MMIKRDKNVTINFFGIGCSITKYRISKIEKQRMENVSAKMGTTLDMALLDADFFQTLNNNNCSSINDLKKIFHTEGLYDGYKNQIEIWVEGKRKRTIKNIHYENEIQLFPPYNIKRIPIRFYNKRFQTITKIESTIGLIKRIKFNVPNFEIEKLCFIIEDVEISSGNIQPIFCQLIYNNIPIKFCASDCVVTNTFFIVE